MRTGKKNYFAKAVTTVLLTACFLAGSVPVAAEEAAYRTTTVARGSMTVEVKIRVNYDYVKKVPVKINSPYGSTTFLGYLVTMGSIVSAGEAIADIETNVDEIVVEETRLRLQRAEESRERAYANMSEQHEAAKRLVEESSGTQQQIAQLRLEQLEMEQERSKRQLDEQVDSIQRQLDAYEEAMGVTQIYAPTFGRIINSLYSTQPGIGLWDGMQIGVIESNEETLFSAQDTNGVMRYGMRMTILGVEGVDFDAKVVSGGAKYLSSGLVDGKAYIKSNAESAWGYEATYNNVDIDNVLLVDAAAVQTDKNGTYVVELKNGELSKCYFTVGKTVNDLCYAIDGLTEGMTVVIR